jgi:hypothetical protein
MVFCPAGIQPGIVIYCTCMITRVAENGVLGIFLKEEMLYECFPSFLTECDVLCSFRNLHLGVCLNFFA